jgi:predicted RNase H-like nuclease (RuvC/YqgF family)
MQHNALASRFLRGAKDLIWQEEPPARKKIAPPTPATAPAPSQIEAVSAATQNLASENKLQAQLLELVMQPATAFAALSEATSALREIVLDEATRYRSAFAFLKKTQQCDQAQLAQALQSHLDVLAAEVQRFHAQSNQAQSHEITARQQEVEQLQQEAAQLQQQIAQLAAIAEQKQAKAQALRAEIEQKERDIAATKQEFSQAVAWVEQKLLQQKQKMEQYLV